MSQIALQRFELRGRKVNPDDGTEPSDCGQPL